MSPKKSPVISKEKGRPDYIKCVSMNPSPAEFQRAREELARFMQAIGQQFAENMKQSHDALKDVKGVRPEVMRSVEASVQASKYIAASSVAHASRLPDVVAYADALAKGKIKTGGKTTGGKTTEIKKEDPHLISLKKIAEFAVTESKWVASEYDYLNKMLLKIEKRQYEAAESDIRNIGRSERRVKAFDDKLKKELKELLKNLQPAQKPVIENVKKELEILSKILIDNNSRYRGKIAGRYRVVRRALRQYEDLLRKRNINIWKKQLELRTADAAKRGKILRDLDDLKKLFAAKKAQAENLQNEISKDLENLIKTSIEKTHGMQVLLRNLEHPEKLIPPRK